MIIKPAPNSQFGAKYFIGPFVFSRNHGKTNGLKGTYYWEARDLDPSLYGELTDEEMQELFMAYQAMRREYETGQDINYDSDQGT